MSQDPFLQPGTSDNDRNFHSRNARGRGRGRRKLSPPTATMVYCPPCMKHFEAPARTDYWNARVELCSEHSKLNNEKGAIWEDLQAATN